MPLTRVYAHRVVVALAWPQEQGQRFFLLQRCLQDAEPKGALWEMQACELVVIAYPQTHEAGDAVLARYVCRHQWEGVTGWVVAACCASEGACCFVLCCVLCEVL